MLQMPAHQVTLCNQPASNPATETGSRQQDRETHEARIECGGRVPRLTFKT